MRELVVALAEGEAPKPAQFGEVIQPAQARGLFEGIVPTDGELDAKAKSKFGKLLKSYDGRLVGLYRFTLEGKNHSRRFNVAAPER
jgi:hypothetical protein